MLFTVRVDGGAGLSSHLTTFESVRQGVRLVINRSPLKQLMFLIAFNGYMHMGVYLVTVPYVATQVYGFSSTQFGLLQLMFVLGMIAAHIGLYVKKTIPYPGQGALFTLLYTAVIGFALSKQPTVTGFYGLIFCWGLVAGNSAGRCRLVLQALSEAELKGRLISIYQFMLFGCAPLGAILTGYLVTFMETEWIFTFMSVSSVALFIGFILSKSLWAVQQEVEAP